MRSRVLRVLGAGAVVAASFAPATAAFAQSAPRGVPAAPRAVAPAAAAPTTAPAADADRALSAPTEEPSPASNSSTKFLVAGLIVLAAGLFIYVMMSMLMGKESSLGDVLQAYDDAPDGDEYDEPRQLTHASLRRAVTFAESFATRRGVLERVERQLEEAAVPFRPGEFLVVWVIGGLLFIVLGAVMMKVFGFIFAVAIAALLPNAILKLLVRRRQKAFTSQLPDVLHMLSGTLRAGYSLMQGVDAVSQEAAEPAGGELRRVVIEAQLGRPLEDALSDCAMRMHSVDFEWAVMAIRIQREVGGNLSELLLTVAETMTERERLRREVSALTAEGKMSAIVLGCLPVGLGAAMYVINPDYTKVLFEETVGQVMLGGAIVLALAGFAWMRKLIQIEV